jgi:Spy/CpxP family protein refolding chaperone
MKHLLKTVTVAAVLTQVTGVAFAQPTPPDPATMIAAHVTRLTALLSLTASQATRITTILTNTQSSLATVETTLQTDHTSLDTAVTTNDTAAIDQLATTIGGLQGQILDLRGRAAAQVYALLTSDQQTKLSSIGGVDALGGGPGPGGRGGPHP